MLFIERADSSVRPTINKNELVVAVPQDDSNCMEKVDISITRLSEIVQKKNLIGSGATGKVYRCHHIRKEDGSYVAKVENGRSKMMEKLEYTQKHTNKAHEFDLAPQFYQVVEYKTSDGNALYVSLMDFVLGKTLDETIYELGGDFDSEEEDIAINMPSLRILWDRVFQAIQRLHAILPQGHGDLNPQNIMVRPNGSIVFIDFGGINPKSKREEWHDYLSLLRYVGTFKEELAYDVTRRIDASLWKELEDDFPEGVKRIMKMALQVTDLGLTREEMIEYLNAYGYTDLIVRYGLVTRDKIATEELEDLVLYWWQVFRVSELDKYMVV